MNWCLMVLLLAMAGKEVIRAWPVGGHKAVALILLALALWSSSKGVKAGAAVGSVVFWFVIILYLLLFAEVVGSVKLQWLKPTTGMVALQGATILFTPVLAAGIFESRKKPDRRCILIGIFCVVAAVLTTGVLSPGVAMGKENGFYQAIRSIPMRYEAVLSAATTVGWFLLMTLYLALSSPKQQKTNSAFSCKSKWIAVILAGIVVTLNVRIPEGLLLPGTVIIGLIIPVVKGIQAQRKKSKKIENNA